MALHVGDFTRNETKESDKKRNKKIYGIPLLYLRLVFNGLYALSAFLFGLSYLWSENYQHSFYTSDPYIGWAILALILGFIINLIYAIKR